MIFKPWKTNISKYGDTRHVTFPDMNYKDSYVIWESMAVLARFTSTNNEISEGELFSYICVASLISL